MGWTPSFRLQQKAAELISAYPEAGAACLPLLHEIQEEAGFLPRESLLWVSQMLSVPRSMVEGVVSFYTMFHLEPVGKYHLELCTNISCSLCGSEVILQTLEKELGVRIGETTKDGLFTLNEVECLATCGMGPAMRVGDEIHENLTPEKVLDLLRRLRQQERK